MPRENLYPSDLILISRSLYCAVEDVERFLGFSLCARCRSSPALCVAPTLAPWLCSLSNPDLRIAPAKVTIVINRPFHSLRFGGWAGRVNERYGDLSTDGENGSYFTLAVSTKKPSQQTAKTSRRLPLDQSRQYRWLCLSRMRKPGTDSRQRARSLTLPSYSHGAG